MLDMRIEDYRITSDSRNIVLSKVRRDEEGNIRYTETKDIGYFQTVSSCLKAIQRDYVLSEERTIKSIIEYKKALENITRQFEQACEIEEEVE